MTRPDSRVSKIRQVTKVQIRAAIPLDALPVPVHHTRIVLLVPADIKAIVLPDREDIKADIREIVPRVPEDIRTTVLPVKAAIRVEAKADIREIVPRVQVDIRTTVRPVKAAIRAEAKVDIKATDRLEKADFPLRDLLRAALAVLVRRVHPADIRGIVPQDRAGLDPGPRKAADMPEEIAQEVILSDPEQKTRISSDQKKITVMVPRAHHVPVREGLAVQQSLIPIFL